MVNTAPDHTQTRKEPPMPKLYTFTPSEIPNRRTQSMYSDIVADFIAQGAESMEISLEA